MFYLYRSGCDSYRFLSRHVNDMPLTSAPVPTLLLAMIVGLILKTVRRRRARRAMLEHQIRAAYRDVWALREDARHLLAQGCKPVRYLKAIGLEPQQL